MTTSLKARSETVGKTDINICRVTELNNQNIMIKNNPFCEVNRILKNFGDQCNKQPIVPSLHVQIGSYYSNEIGY